MARTHARLAGTAAALALLLAGGCLSNPKSPSGNWLKSLRSADGPQGADVVVMEVSVIEQPVGDGYLNRELWSTIDEGIVAIDRKAVLEDNGFRVAVTAGITPGVLHRLLSSERSNPDPHLYRTRAGTAKLLVFGEQRAKCTFDVRLDGTPVAAELEQAQCVLAVTPSLTTAGLIKLAFMPLVRHGAPRLLTQNEQGDFVLHSQRPSERYPNLGFEVTLAPQDYLVVGTWNEKDQTLGHRCFVAADGAKPMQRLLAIRANRLQAPGSLSEFTDGEAATDAAAGPRTAPLAYQASVTVRGSRD